MGWLRLSPAPPIEMGVEEPELGAREEEQEDGQEEEVELQATRGAELERRSEHEPEPEPLCGDSSFISIWFLRGPVEMFWMLYWLKEELDEGSGDEEAWDATAEGMGGACVLVGELMGM